MFIIGWSIGNNILSTIFRESERERKKEASTCPPTVELYIGAYTSHLHNLNDT